MRITKREFEKDGSGKITFFIDDDEDIWHLYNLVSAGNEITSTTYRKVQKGAWTDDQRVRMLLTITVEKIEYDPIAHNLRISGPLAKDHASGFVRQGQYHTLQLSADRRPGPIHLHKESWDSVDMERMSEACDVKSKAELAAVVLHEGLAHVCLVTRQMTVVQQRIDMSVPKKRTMDGGKQHGKGLNRFFNAVGRAVEYHVKWEIVHCVVVGSPGFLREVFFEYLMENFQSLKQYRDRFLLVPSSSGHKQAITDILGDPSVQKLITDKRATSEIESLRYFFSVLAQVPERAFYGPKHVSLAVFEFSGIVETLLVTDELFRSADVETRKHHIKLLDCVKERGGAVHVLSTLHVSGQQLKQLSGVAAVLRYPLPSSVVDSLIDEEEIVGEDEEEKRDEVQEEEEKEPEEMKRVRSNISVSENEGDGTHGSLSGTDSEDELSDREDEYLSDLQKTLNRLKMERNKLLQENDEK